MKRIIRASKGTTADMLDAFKEELSAQGIESATSIDMLDAFNDKIDELEAVGSATVVASGVYRDTNGQLGEPGATYTDSELRDYWRNNHNSDPSLAEYEDGESWLQDTLPFMEEIESCDSIHASVDFQDDNYGAKMRFELDEDKVDALTAALESEPENNQAAIDEWELKYDDGIGHQDASFALFVGFGMVPDVDYVGVPPYSVYVMEPSEVWDEVIKSIGVPGSEEMLGEGIEMTEDIMCDDDSQRLLMLMSYSSDPEAGIDGDEFDCWGKFYAPSLEDAKAELAELKETSSFLSHTAPYNDVYVDEYNDYFDDGGPIASNLATLVSDLEQEFSGDYAETMGDPDVDDIPFN